MGTPWLVVIVLGGSAARRLGGSAAYFTAGTLLKRRGRGLWAGTKANPRAENAIIAVQWALTAVALVVALVV